MAQPIRVGIVDDAQVFRESLRTVLEKNQGLEILAEAEDGRSAIDMVDKYLPDLVIMDLSMPGLGGLDATRAIVSQHPDIRVVILTMHADLTPIEEVLSAGACTLISKSSSLKEIVISIFNCMGAGQAA